MAGGVVGKYVHDTAIDGDGNPVDVDETRVEVRLYRIQIFWVKDVL